jgi:glycosyltransferase involved in cell wall biosynthesis
VNQQRSPRVRAAASVAQSVRLPSVLVMTHSHPRLTRGGAEISADMLYRGLRERGGQAWFLGCDGAGSQSRLGASITQPFGPDDYLYSPAAPFDYFKFANPDPAFPAAFEALVGALKPDIVHAHHYTRFGVECFAVIRRANPSAKIVLSLHEYLAICHNNGQMVKTVSGRLCERDSTLECARCFPEHAPRDFFLRKLFIQTFLEDVDLFLAPSRFLANRYIAWGLPSDKVQVLENMPPPSAGASEAQPPARMAADTLLPAGSRKLRIGFFGQMSPLKGISMLIDAARILNEAGVGGVTIDIHGEYTNQPAEYQAPVKAALEGATPNIAYHGRYENAQVHTLMRRMDAVVVPSVWWENSPVVIQEAYRSGKPVICSNIGGMAEKVRDGIDGLHFEANRPEHLARVLAGLLEAPHVLDQLAATLARPLDQASALDAHLAAYARILA